MRSTIQLWNERRAGAWNAPEGDLWNEPNELKRANFVMSQRAMSLVFGNEPQERFRSVEALCGIVAYNNHQDFRYQMSKYEKTLQYILGARMDTSIRFSDVVSLLKRLGFNLRIRGGHHIFSCEGIEEIINIQPKGTMAKAYQVKQIREILLRYKIGIETDE